MADFGQYRLWPIPTLTCGVLCLCVVVVLLLWWWWCWCWFHSFMVWGSRVGVGFKVLVMFGAPGPPKMQARALGPPGFHTTTREPKRGHLRVLSFKKHQNSTEGPPRKRRKHENCGGRKEKKARIFGRSGGGGSSGPVKGARWSKPTTTRTTTTNTPRTTTQHNTTH